MTLGRLTDRQTYSDRSTHTYMHTYIHIYIQTVFASHRACDSCSLQVTLAWGCTRRRHPPTYPPSVHINTHGIHDQAHNNCTLTKSFPDTGSQHGVCSLSIAMCCIIT